MSSVTSTVWRGVRFWLLVAGVVLLLGIVWGVIVFLPVFRSHESFPMRHVEATPLIEAVYRHYQMNGQWPDEATVSRVVELPSEWIYEANVDPSDSRSTPVLFLHGPYHLGLVYYFEPPVAGKASQRWRKSFEGFDGEFEADLPYRTN